MTDQQRQSPVALCWMAPTLHCQKSKTCLQETVREAGHADSVGAECCMHGYLDLWLWTCRSFQFLCVIALDNGLNNQEPT